MFQRIHHLILIGACILVWSSTAAIAQYQIITVSGQTYHAKTKPKQPDRGLFGFSLQGDVLIELDRSQIDWYTTALMNEEAPPIWSKPVEHNLTAKGIAGNQHQLQYLRADLHEYSQGRITIENLIGASKITLAALAAWLLFDLFFSAFLLWVSMKLVSEFVDYGPLLGFNLVFLPLSLATSIACFLVGLGPLVAAAAGGALYFCAWLILLITREGCLPLRAFGGTLIFKALHGGTWAGVFLLFHMTWLHG